MKRLMVAISLVVVLSVNAFAKPKEMSWLRVVNLSPDSPAVDVFLGGKPEFKNLSFKTIESYVQVPSGKHDVQFIEAGGKKEQVIADCKIKLKGGQYNSIVLFGFFKNKSVHAIELKDEHATAVQDAKLRFVHLSPDVPSVDVLDAKGGRLFKGVAFKKSSDYISLIPEDYTFLIREKNAKTEARKTEVKLEAGTNYTLFMIGDAKDSSLHFVHVVDVSGKGKAVTQEAERTGKDSKSEKKAKSHKAGKAAKGEKKETTKE
jgi:hypothetical protein